LRVIVGIRGHIEPAARISRDDGYHIRETSGCQKVGTGFPGKERLKNHRELDQRSRRTRLFPSRRPILRAVDDRNDNNFLPIIIDSVDNDVGYSISSRVPSTKPGRPMCARFGAANRMTLDSMRATNSLAARGLSVAIHLKI